MSEFTCRTPSGSPRNVAGWGLCPLACMFWVWGLVAWSAWAGMPARARPATETATMDHRTLLLMRPTSSSMCGSPRAVRPALPTGGPVSGSAGVRRRRLRGGSGRDGTLAGSGTPRLYPFPNRSRKSPGRGEGSPKAEGGRLLARPHPSPGARLPDRELLGLRVQVAEHLGAGHSLIAEQPGGEPASDVGFVDHAVVPVRGPVTAHDQRGLRQRRRVREGDLLGVLRIAEVHDADPGLVVAADDHVPLGGRHDVVVVDRAVLRVRLRPREHPSADLVARVRVEEEHRFVDLGARRLALRLTTATGLVSEDERLAVPGEGRGVPDAHPLNRSRVQDLRIRQ